MLRFENLTLKYGKQTVIDQLNFEFPEGSTIAITGSSGIGKTTILNAIAGFLKPQNGCIYTDHRAPSYIFQEPRLFPWMTALENVSAVCKNPQYAKELLNYLIPDIDAASKYPNELSGGMKQRVSIARALAYDFDLLLMDEPFKGLDPETRCEISRFVFEALKGKTVIMVTHDAQDLEFADVVLELTSAPNSMLKLVKTNTDIAE